jgi:hypothetical protein
MFAANPFGSFYFGQAYVPTTPYVPPPPPPEFEEQLGILVRHRCGTPVFAVESDSVCEMPEFAVSSETRRVAGDIGVTTSARCSTPTIKMLTQNRVQRPTRWPTVSIRC